jgi:hypothetical protein
VIHLGRREVFKFALREDIIDVRFVALVSDIESTTPGFLNV